MRWSSSRLRRLTALTGATVLVALVAAMTAGGAAPVHRISFDMVRSGGIVGAGCLPDAIGHVTVINHGPVEVMRLQASGLPRNTNFDFFVTQVPNPPFGLSWYQGDFET